LSENNIPKPYSDFFETKDKIIVSMGREDDVKGFWHLIKAFKRVNETIPDTKLAIIGEGRFEEYRQMAEDMQISDRVFFAGLQKNPFPFIRACDVYVLSSISEGLPNALVETLALEVPIVSVNCKSGPAEILHGDWEKVADNDDITHADYGILSSKLLTDKNVSCKYENGKIKLEASEENLASAIIEMLENHDLYSKYKNGSLKRAMEFSSKNYKRSIIKIIDMIGA
jgi:glycosyltransferase involved in cell wall biosynthesis